MGMKIFTIVLSFFVMQLFLGCAKKQSLPQEQATQTSNSTFSNATDTENAALNEALGNTPLQVVEKDNKQNITKAQNTQEESQNIDSIQAYESLKQISRLEPKIGTKTMEVYIVDKTALTNYRVKLLNNMLKNLQKYCQNTGSNIAVFIKMDPQYKMSFNIYNKDVIFSAERPNYRYITIDSISMYFDNMESLKSKVNPREVLQYVSLSSAENKESGSNYSKHLKALNKGLEVAQYLLPFSEIIAIDSVAR